MFFVYNKDKIISVAIALSTVLILFLVAGFIEKRNSNNALQTSANNSRCLQIYKVDTNDKKVSLTINCAWNADDIDLILEVLSNNDVKATFFIVGSWAEKFPEAVKKIENNGNEIANHSYSHPHINNLSYEENVEEITKCSDIIKKITGKETYMYRVPYGEYSDTVTKASEDTNHIMVKWSIDSLDYEGLTCEQMLERIIPKLENGSIILMHNGTENTALSLDTIIKEIKEKGYTIAPLSELIYTNDYTIDNNGMQHKN